MPETITLTLPATATDADRLALEQALARRPDVDDVTAVKARGFDAATVKLWLEVGAVALPLLTGLVELVRGRGLKGVTITTPAGTITADEASAADLERLIAAARPAAGR